MNPPRVYMSSQSWTPRHLSPHIISLGHPSALAPSILYPISNLDWWFVSYMIAYMFQCHSPKSSCSRPLPQSPKDRSIHLCLFCCLTYRVIVTIFLNSIYMHYYTVLVFFFLACFISNLMPPLIWQEVPVHSPEVGDPCSIPSIYFSYQKKFSHLHRQLPLPLAANGDSLWSGVLLLQAQLPGDGSEVSSHASTIKHIWFSLWCCSHS